MAERTTTTGVATGLVWTPAGAIKKDGPSAGIAIYCALAPLYSGREMKNNLAMNGEITLRGQALPVGGGKAKALAAARAGIRTVLLPAPTRRT